MKSHNEILHQINRYLAQLKLRLKIEQVIEQPDNTCHLILMYQSGENKRKYQLTDTPQGLLWCRIQPQF